MSWIEKNKVIIIVLICCAGILLRFYAIGSESYWFDEKMSLQFSQQDTFSILNPPSYETQIPPLYYILLHFWIGLVGSSEFAVRSLSAIFGSISIFALYKLGKYLFNVKVAIYSSLIFTVSIFQIYFSQEARMYSLLTVTTLFSIFFFLKSLRENRLRYWASYVITSILMLYAHFYGLFILIFQFLYLLFYYRNRIGCAKNCLVAFFLVILGFFPWLIKLFEVTPYILEGYSAISWIPKPNVILILGTILMFCNSSVVTLLVFGCSIGGIFPVDSLKKFLNIPSFFEKLKRIKAYFFDNSKFGINFCIAWIGIPVILSLLISLVIQPIYMPKYLILVSPAFYLLVSKGLTKRKLKIRYILILILLIDSAMITYSYYASFNKEQWREAASYIQDNEEVGDLVVINAYYLELNFKHYYNGSNAVKGILTTDQLNETLQAAEYHKVWLILSHDDIADPNGQLKRALEDNYQLVSEKEFVSQDVLNSVSILGYPVAESFIKIRVYSYSK